MKRRVLTVMLSLAVTITSVPATAFGSADGFGDGQAAEVVAAPEEVVVEDADAFQAEAAAPEEAAEAPAETEPAAADGEEFVIDVPETEEISLDAPEAVVPAAEEVPEDMPEFGAEVEEDVPVVMAEAKTLANITVKVKKDSSSSDIVDLTGFADSDEGRKKEAAGVELDYNPAKGTNQDSILLDSIKYDGVEEPLKLGTDYTVTSKNCDGAGKSTDDDGGPQLVIAFQGDYVNLGTISVTFTIKPKSLAGATITYPEAPGTEKTWEFTYDGKEHYPDVSSVVLSVQGTKYTLTEGKDYKKKADDPINQGTDKSLTIEGINNYTGTAGGNVSYTIKQADAKDGVVCGTYETEESLVFYREAKSGEQEGLNASLTTKIETAIKATVKNKFDVDEETGEANKLPEKEYKIVYYQAGVLGAGQIADTEALKSAPGLHTYNIEIQKDGTEGAKNNFAENTKVSGSYMVYDGHSLEYIYSEWKADDLETTKTIKENIEAELTKGEKNTYTGEDLLGEDTNSDGIRKVIATEFVKYAAVDGDMAATNLKITALQDGKEVEKVINAGDYIFRVTGAETTKWADQHVDIPVTINPKNIWKSGTEFITNVTVTSVTQKYYANGKWGVPEIVLRDSTTELKAGTDYEIIGGDYDAAKRNKATKIEIKGIGNYTTENTDTKTPDKVSDTSVVYTITEDQAKNITALVDLLDEDTVKAEVNQTIKYGEKHEFKLSEITVIQTDPDGVEITIGPENYTISEGDTYEGEIAGEQSLKIKGNAAGKIPCTGERTVLYTAEGIKFDEAYKVGTNKVEVTMGELVDRPDLGVVSTDGVKLQQDLYKVSYYRVETVEEDKTEKEARVYIKSATGNAQKTEPILVEDIAKKTTAAMNAINAARVGSGEQVVFDEAGEYFMEIVPNQENSGMKKYTGMIEGIKITVSPRDLTELSKESGKIEVQIEPSNNKVTWPGETVTKENLTSVTVTDTASKVEVSGYNLKETTDSQPDGDYIVTIKDGNAIGETKVVITGTGKNYVGTIEEDLTIEQADLTNAEVTLKDGMTEVPACADMTKALTSEDVKVVTDGGGSHTVNPSEYDVVCAVDAGGTNVTIKVTAKKDGHYTKSATSREKYPIKATADISNAASFQVDYADPVYYYKADGENAGKQAALTLTDVRTDTVLKGIAREAAKTIDPTKDVKPDYDYTVSYEGLEKLADSDTAQVSVILEGVSGKKDASGAGDAVGYTGKITKTYLVKKPSIAKVEIKAGEYIYTGKEIVPEIVSVTDDNGKAVDAKDYVVKGSVNAGAATVEVTPAKDSGYIGFARAAFEIKKAANEIEVTVPEVHVGESRQLEAKANDAELTFTLKSGDAASVDTKGVVTGKKEGTVTVTVKAAATDNYEAAEKDVEVKVLPAASLKDISKYTVKLAETSYTYDGTEKEPQIVSVSNGTETLKAADYDVAYLSNVNAGAATVKVLGKGSYTGTASAEFTIKKAKNAVDAEDVQRLFMSKARKFSLQASAAYENAALSYKSDNAKIKVDAKGNVTIAAGYAGSAKITVTAAATANYEAASTTMKVGARPSKTEITRLSQNGTGIRVQYKKNSVGDGFQIQYSKSPAFTDVKNVYVKNINCLTKTVGSKLQKGAWYVRVRVFKFESGKSGTKLFSPWSDGVKKTIK